MGGIFAGLQPQLHDQANLQQNAGSWSNKQISLQLEGRGDRHPVFGHESESGRYSVQTDTNLEVQIQILVQKYAERRRIHKDLLNVNPRPKRHISIGQKAHLTHDIAFKNNRDDCLLFISRSEPTVCFKTCSLPPWNISRIWGQDCQKRKIDLQLNEKPM